MYLTKEAMVTHPPPKHVKALLSMNLLSMDVLVKYMCKTEPFLLIQLEKFHISKYETCSTSLLASSLKLLKASTDDAI